MEIEETKNRKDIKSWLKKLGAAGFLFFFIKGLLWIAAVYYGLRITGCDN